MTSIKIVESIEVGATVEIGMLRVHRYADCLVLWDITNAGKRGKRVPRVTVSPAFSRGLVGSAGQALLERVCKMLGSYESFELAVTTLKSLNQETECLSFEYREERGVDVRPSGRPVIEIRTQKIRLTVDFRNFSVEDVTDKHNEPTAISVDQKSVDKFYRWVSNNRATMETFTFREVLDNMRKLGITYHSYCAMD